MRLPNGFGNVSKLPGNRRKPYRARVTIGWRTDKEGRKHQQFKTIGYYATRQEGLLALCNYHQMPTSAPERLTFREVYTRWSAEHYAKISESNQKGYITSFGQCQSLYDLVFADLRLAQLQNVVDTSQKNYPILRRIKILFSQLYKYALRHDICQKNYSVYVDVTQYKDRNPNGFSRTVFTDEEIDLLWAYAPTSRTATIVLMLIYCGCRISELLDLKTEDVDLQNKYFYISHSKTPSGVRHVPIADKVFPFWQRWYTESRSGYLLYGARSSRIQYQNFYGYYWTPLMEELHMHHSPHDTRHTCITLLTLAKTDDKIIRKIVGHKGKNITESVYTHFDIKDLKDAIDQI